MHTPEVQHLNQQLSIYFHSVSVTVAGNKAALAPCDGKLDMEQEDPGVSCTAKTVRGKSQHLPAIPVLQVRV